MLLNLILKGLIFFGFFFGGLTNGCSLSSFFYFLGLGKLDGRVGLPTFPLFIIHKIVDYEKYSGTVRTVPFGTMPFIKNAFAFSMKSICALFCRMHWQNKVLPYWVFWRWFCDKLNENWRMLSFWVGYEMIMFIFWVGYEWWLGGRRYPTTIYCAFLKVKKSAACGSYPQAGLAQVPYQ